MDIHILEFVLYANSSNSMNVCVGCGMVKLLWPQEETRTRLGKKFIILTGPREGGSHVCHSGSQRVSIRFW